MLSTDLASGSYVSSDVFHCDWVFHCQSVMLALHSSLVHQHSGISSQPSKGKGYMLVNTAYFSHCPGVLQLCQGSLLNCQHYSVLSTDCHLAYAGYHTGWMASWCALFGHLPQLSLSWPLPKRIPPGIDDHPEKIQSTRYHTCSPFFKKKHRQMGSL